MKRILIVDNFDSFTYNLLHLLGENFSGDIMIKRNNEINIDFVRENNFDAILISPGPKTPKKTPISVEIVKKFHKHIPIFGVCLGMQCINEAFGGSTIPAHQPIHGKIGQITHTNESLFRKLSQNFHIARYHSLIVDDIPDELKILAVEKNDKSIMALKHKKYPVFGVQFHPESFLTEFGKEIMLNFINEAKLYL